MKNLSLGWPAAGSPSPWPRPTSATHVKSTLSHPRTPDRIRRDIEPVWMMAISTDFLFQDAFRFF